MENGKLKEAIIGVWHSPTYQNIYCFYPPKTHDEYGAMALLQFKAKMPILFSYKLIQKDSQTYLDLDGHRHEVILNNEPDATLNLISPRKDMLILSKGFPQRDDRENGAKLVA